MSLRVGAAASFVLAVFLFSGHAHAATLEECKKIGADYRPATAEDAVVKNNQIKLSECYNPNTPGIGQSAEEAKQYLNNLPKRPLSNCAPPTPDNIKKLNAAFAVCAARFFQEYTKRFGTVYITSAFRDAAPGSAGNGSGQSANACAGGVNGSNHTRGVAMDVNPANEALYPQMWYFAKSNPQFGVCFPHLSGDRPHMILAGIGGSESARCAAQGVTKPCDGSGYDPNSVRAPAAPPQSPTAQIADAFRSALGMQTAQPAFPSQQAYSQQPFAQQQPVFNSFNMPAPALTPTSGSPSPTSGSPSQTSGGVTTGTSASTTSVSDRLAELLATAGTGAVATAGTSSVPLIVTGASAVQLASANPSGSVQGGVSEQSTTSSVAGGSPVQQTFASDDLDWVVTNPQPQQSGLLQILETLKQVLLMLLEYLKPFGGLHTGDGTA